MPVSSTSAPPLPSLSHTDALLCPSWHLVFSYLEVVCLYVLIIISTKPIYEKMGKHWRNLWQHALAMRYRGAETSGLSWSGWALGCTNGDLLLISG